VGMGDSITNGFDDDVFADDASADGRNISRGYEPILNNKLSAQLGRPITVFNEDLGGTTVGTDSAGGVRTGSRPRSPDTPNLNIG
jgi:hypothetical protein